ncbi:MAG: hypothetical protein FJ216_09325 [Ignavibacteria bacterium]|nr:hypothetical protein [Ignavibacteria bacterium]
MKNVIIINIIFFFILTHNSLQGKNAIYNTDFAYDINGYLIFLYKDDGDKHTSKIDTCKYCSGTGKEEVIYGLNIWTFRAFDLNEFGSGGRYYPYVDKKRDRVCRVCKGKGIN